MLNLVEKDFRVAIINMLTELKETMNKDVKQRISVKRQNFKIKIKKKLWTSLEELNSTFELAEKRINNLVDMIMQTEKQTEENKEKWRVYQKNVEHH